MITYRKRQIKKRIAVIMLRLTEAEKKEIKKYCKKQKITMNQFICDSALANLSWRT